MARFHIRWPAVATIGLLLSLFAVVNLLFRDKSDIHSMKSTAIYHNPPGIHLATVSCGRPNYVGEKDFEKPLTLSLTMMKSAALFAKEFLNLHIFTENEMIPMFESEIQSWPQSVLNRITYKFYAANYGDQLPEDLIEEWKEWYKPCGSFRLFLPVMLMNFTRMIIADWRLFEGAEALNLKTTKYGPDLLLAYYKRYKESAEHDQKLLNIMFHYNPELLYKLPCSWNFKHNFCTDDKNVCEDAEANGAGAVHGISGTFFGDDNPTFKGLYESFSKYKLGDDLKKKLYKKYMAYIGAYASRTFCGKKSRIILDPLRQSISKVKFEIDGL